MANPPSQKHRPISFHLAGGAGEPVYLTLMLRPEELTNLEASRLTVQQTLGGAWADAYGRGVASLTLKGHTGWRGGGQSGEEAFLTLRDTVFKGWHDRRAVAVASGIDPDTVELTYIDDLNGITALVAPKTFQLSRSKASPLLLRYTIELAMLADCLPVVVVGDPISAALDSATRWVSVVEAVTTVVGMIEATAGTVVPVVGAVVGTVAAAVETVIGFVSLAGAVLTRTAGAVLEAAGMVDGATAALVELGLSVAAAGQAAFGALAMADLPAQDKGALMQLAGLFGDARCALTDLDRSIRYPDHGALYGASNCSSTAGGRRWSTFQEQWSNPFDALSSAATPPYTVTAGAHAALRSLSRDPLALAAEPGLVLAGLATITTGIEAAA
jgi:hypothetical protein